MNYLWHLLTLIALYTVLAASLNAVTGYGGILSLCHAVFYGIGAYTTTILTLRVGWGFPESVLAGVLVATLVGAAVAFAAARVTADDFVLMTIGLQVIFVALLENLPDLTGGPYGIPGVPVPRVMGIAINSPFRFALISVLVALPCLAVLRIMTHSPFGRVLKAIREDEAAAASLGKNVAGVKTIAFASAAGIAAVPGAFYAGYIRYIDPSSFGLTESVLILSMVALGGAGSLSGPLIGAACLIGLPEMLKFVAVPEPIAAASRQILFGLVLILIMRLRPRGLRGEYGFERRA